MLPIDAVHTLNDAVHWWGCLAGFVGLADLWRQMIGIVPRHELKHTKPVVRLGICLFLILAGSAIPLTQHVGWLHPDGMPFALIMLAAWWAVAIAAWAMTVQYVDRIAPMRLVSWLALIGTIGASFAVRLTA